MYVTLKIFMKKLLTTFISLALILSACNSGQSAELLDASLWTVPHSIEGGEGLSFKLPESLTYQGGGDTDSFSRSYVTGKNGEAAYFNITNFVLQKCPGDAVSCSLEDRVSTTPQKFFEAQVEDFSNQSEWTDGGEIIVGNTTGHLFTSNEETIEYDMVLFYGSEGAYRADNYMSPELFDIFLSTFEVTQESTAVDFSRVIVDQIMNEDGTVTISVNGESREIATIEKEKPLDGYSTYVFDEAYPNIYVAVDPTGFGGYILYGGAFELYEVDVVTGNVNQLGYEGQATDISEDGSHIASMSHNEKGENLITVKEVYGLDETIIEVAAEFGQAGDAHFNPAGTKVAYQATNTDEGSNEETAVFVIDLATGEQTEFARQEGLYEIVWQDNDRPIVE